jgi:hypothetical protein
MLQEVIRSILEAYYEPRSNLASLAISIAMKKRAANLQGARAITRQPLRHPIRSPRSCPILITPNQLGLINKLAKRAGLDPDVLSQEMYRASVNKISRRAASALIDHLNAHLQQQ